ncbi:alcohol oxidase [Aureobasidium sp. EXF-3400]|nr:alcohol oxidase [Aureobasidium sp. EXF-12344]KAI4774272.1 alcohol oxidase [Aureobasidium sp. EXF-3400]
MTNSDVVVGGGTAGLVMATRLAENGTYTVAVVEAGGFYELENGNLTIVPGYYSQNLGHPSVDWNFKTTPQVGLENQTFDYARGKTLGGSSALNVMAYHRGTRQSYASWAHTVDDQSYAFDSFLPFFEKSINYTTPNQHLRAANATIPPANASAFSGADGPLHVSHANWATPFASWGQLALREIGILDIPDFESGELLGSQYVPATLRPDDETRSTSESSYLQQSLAGDDSRLEVFIHTMAKRIIFDSNKTATGVVVETAGTPYTLNATREVILSAGALQSPQLLMTSGIGPKSTLQQYNISMIADRPGVGSNMWDHVLFPVMYEVNLETQQGLVNTTFANEAAMEYNKNATGVLTNSGGDYLGWEKLPEQNFAQLSNTTQQALSAFPADWPNLEFLLTSFPPNMKGVEISDSKQYASVSIALITPLSRGNISISSNDTTDPPLVNPGWLSNSSDVEVAVQAVKRGRDFFGASAIRPVLIGEELLPGRNVTTDAEIEEFVRQYVATVWHASCTCAMGKLDDPMAVVDSKARVIGVKSLRVVDASAFPFLPPGHPQATVYALAEKIAADVIADDTFKG